MVALKNSYPHYNIRGVQLENLNMTDQLRIFSQSDIVIGENRLLLHSTSGLKSMYVLPVIKRMTEML